MNDIIIYELVMLQEPICKTCGKAGDDLAICDTCNRWSDYKCAGLKQKQTIADYQVFQCKECRDSNESCLAFLPKLKNPGSLCCLYIAYS
jgi:hypothetical protein